jgi:hypothetical protein
MLISEIRDEMIEEMALDSSDDTVLSVILTCIKGAIRRFATFAKSRKIVTTAELTLTIDTNYVSLPADFISEREDGVYYKVDGKRTRILRYHGSNYNELNTTIKGNPSYYWIIGNTIYFDKTAEETKTIYVEHFKDESDVSLSDTFYGSAPEIEIIKDLAKYTYYSDYDEDSNKLADKKLALAKAGIDVMDAQYMVKELPTHVEEA